MSVTDYIHPGWADGARRVRQIIREISDSKGPVGVESHEPWCGGEAIMQDGRCAACNAMREPKVENPYVKRPKVIEEAEHHQVLLEQRVARASSRIEQMSRETKRLKARITQARPCVYCNAMTNNTSEICHSCKIRWEVKAHKAELLAKQPSHVALSLGDGQMISYGTTMSPDTAAPLITARVPSARQPSLAPIALFADLRSTLEQLDKKNYT